jgi:hypothetical protein
VGVAIVADTTNAPARSIEKTRRMRQTLSCLSFLSVQPIAGIIFLPRVTVHTTADNDARINLDSQAKRAVEIPESI